MNFNSLLTELNQFHFIRPEWLWAIPALLLIWLLMGQLGRNTQWESFIAKDKLEALRVTGGRASQLWKWLLIVGWIIGTFAAAGPTWKQVPVPTVRDESAMVIVLDLSRSMLAQDLSPDRLTLARFKLIDILRMRGDGQTALVAYAGEPHTVSPLTDDPRTIEALLPALHPAIMPTQGSNTEAAIDLSIQLLKDAGLSQGEILLMTDGVAADAQKYIRDRFDGSFRLSVLGIGSTDAVPIPREGGGFFTDSRGEIILTKLNRDELQILAGLSGGRYVELQSDDSDIQYLLQDEFEMPDSSEDENALLYDSWEDMGYWLVLLILPFVAYSFRKGAIYVLPLIFILPNQSEALSMEEIWNDLWLTKDQQGAKLMQQDNHAEAAEAFERQDWAGVADFQAQNYQSAADRFTQSTDIESIYNRGNALAFNGDLDAAIEAYDQVLEQQADHEDAAHNKAILEQLMQQQEQQQQQDSSESGEQSQDQQNQDQQSQNNQSSDSQNQQSETDSSEQQSEQSQSQQQAQDQQSGDEQEQSESAQQQSQQQESEQDQNSQQQSAQQSEQQQADEEQKAAQAQQSDENEQDGENDQEQQAMAMVPAEATPDQLEDTSEQWLRAIPDDPSGLLRRKFDYESRQNKREQRYLLQVPTSPDDERY